jgi:translation initiation factor 2 beta subunit (eIF-2beta)/eIF-5
MTLTKQQKKEIYYKNWTKAEIFEYLNKDEAQMQKFWKFMIGQTMTMNKSGETIIYGCDFLDFLLGNPVTD